jgi:ubiquitin carboxyl-terminal hydrolase 7
VLQDRLTEEKKLETMRKKERNEAHLYLQLNIILEKEFYDHLGMSDLFDASKIEATKHLKVKKANTMLEVTKQLAELLNNNVEDIRIWSIMSRYNNTTRPLNSIDLRESANKAVLDVCKQDSCWLIFVEQANDLSFSPSFDYNLLMNTQIDPQSRQEMIQQESKTIKLATPPKLQPFNPKEEVMIFFKYYDPKTSVLRYVFRMHLPITSTLNAIQERINKKMKFPPHTELLFYEEVKISQITPLTEREVRLYLHLVLFQ